MPASDGRLDQSLRPSGRPARRMGEDDLGGIGAAAPPAGLSQDNLEDRATASTARTGVPSMRSGRGTPR